MNLDEAAGKVRGARTVVFSIFHVGPASRSLDLPASRLLKGVAPCAAASQGRSIIGAGSESYGTFILQIDACLLRTTTEMETLLHSGLMFS